jgi:cell division protease FtsH
VALLEENRSRLDSLAQALLEHETLDQPDAYAAAGIEQPRSDEAPERMAAAARTTTS